MARILIVDDDVAVRRALEALLTHHGHTVIVAADGESGAQEYARHQPDLVLLDLTMPGISGVETLQRIKHADPSATAVFLTAFGTVRSAVEAMKAGGFDFLTKPFDNDELMLTIDRALSMAHLRAEVAQLKNDIEGRTQFSSIVGRSPAIRQVVHLLAKVAPVDATVLLLGESGTGKELAARGLHRQSRRASHPFVAINCGTVPATLADATFFGHERGAFTDARESRAGLFEQADGGTLFLDEIGELPVELQVKLLRVLQEREVQRLGGRHPVKVDVRVIAATNRDLAKGMAAGTFRDDLFWRLSGFVITLPPLRDRREDIPLLMDHLIDRLSQQLSLQAREISAEARERLMAHSWPGNVRELEQVLQRALIMCDEPVIGPEHLPPHFGARTTVASGNMGSHAEGTLDDLVRRATNRVERALIESTLAQCRGNRTKAAAQLGISRRTLFTKLKGWDLAPPDDPEDAADD